MKTMYLSGATERIESFYSSMCSICAYFDDRARYNGDGGTTAIGQSEETGI